MSEAVATYDAGAVSPGQAHRTREFTRPLIRNGGWQRCSGGSLLNGGPTASTVTFEVRENRPRRLRKKPDLPETLLHLAWRRAGRDSGSVGGRDGHRYRVIYPGRPADGAGPDFRDAILLRDDGVRIHGHVEIHVRSGDWHSHGHGNDSAYNGVAIHVALDESGTPAETQSGVRIPLLILKQDQVDRGPARLSPDRHGSAAATGPEPPGVTPAPLPTLDMTSAGDEWFRNRSHGCAMQIAHDGADQALWEGALECLGYPSNKKGFRQLASRLDWKTISIFLSNEEMAGDNGPGRSSTSLAELFLQAGGFGPELSGAPRLPGNAPVWQARHGRPANHPRTRTRAAAAWAFRWYKTGGPERTFVSAVRSARTAADLASVFTVPAEPGRPAVLGRSRSRDIVVNHMLPSVYALFAHVQAPGNGGQQLASKAKRLFDDHPLLASNSITREASGMLIARGADGTPHRARQQQGLIHIYRMTIARQHSERQLPLL